MEKQSTYYKAGTVFLCTFRTISEFNLECSLYAPTASSVWTLQFALTVHLSSLLCIQNITAVTFKAAVSLENKEACA